MIYSNASKMVLLIELTSPAEENIEKWREYKQSKYEKLAEHIREGGLWKVKVLTVEIGARGFVAKQKGHVWRTLGFTEAEKPEIDQCSVQSCNSVLSFHLDMQKQPPLGYTAFGDVNCPTDKIHYRHYQCTSL